VELVHAEVAVGSAIVARRHGMHILLEYIFWQSLSVVGTIEFMVHEFIPGNASSMTCLVYTHALVSKNMLAID